jgi:chemotaxis-related protein WspB
MLFILFQVGNGHYALDAAQIAEVMPLVGITRIPQAPPGVAGVFDCGGVPMPVIDLSQLMVDRPAENRLSTRIIVVDYPDESGHMHRLGLIAERVTETIRLERTDFVEAGVASDGAPYLGPVATGARGLVQWVQVSKLLPGSVRDVLFRQPVGA